MTRVSLFSAPFLLGFDTFEERFDRLARATVPREGPLHGARCARRGEHLARRRRGGPGADRLVARGPESFERSAL